VSQAVADFLSLFRAHVLDQLRRDVGPGREHLITPGNITWVLTVPAMWDARAKGAMRDAAVRSGLAKRDALPDELVIALVRVIYYIRVRERFNVLFSIHNHFS
jgi:hypothetical protein